FCIICRGCQSSKLTTTRIYNGGYTEDLHIAVKTINARYPKARIGILGYSLGGNTVAKYLGEQNSQNEPIIKYKQVFDHDPVPEAVIAAASVGCPFDLYLLNQIMSHKEQVIVGKGLITYMKKNSQQLSNIPEYNELIKIPENEIEVRKIDELITSRVFGYKSLDEFYMDASSSKFLDGVRIPLIFISTRNDTVSKFVAMPIQMIENGSNQNISAILLPGGSHLGAFSFCDTTQTYDEQFLFKYFDYYFDQNANKTN
ncbi:MAG: putative AB-hydrolase YheT, partial [Streblomastix strix]